jgi:ribosomal protein L35
VEIVNREEARERGLRFFYTGKPCKRGHVAERYLSGGCAECQRERRSTPEAAATHRENMRRYRATAEGREAGRVANRKHYAANADQCRTRALPGESRR